MISGPAATTAAHGPTVTPKLVTLTIGDQQICARGDRHFRCAIGDVVGVRFDPARAYLFDAASEERIRI